MMDALTGHSHLTSTRATTFAGLSGDVVSTDEANRDQGEGDSSPNDLYQAAEDFEELDEEEERAEGERQEDELLESYPLWGCPDMAEQLALLLDRLEPFSRRPEVHYRFVALDTPIPFASSCTHGTVYFSRALLENLSPESLLFFGAHEMAHTELRHFATRRRRLDDLRKAMPAAPGTPVRQRMELAAVLAVRHQEEFEADGLAGRWTNLPTGRQALRELHQACLRLCPDSLNRPTHPPFEQRVARMTCDLPHEPVEYLWSLLR